MVGGMYFSGALGKISLAICAWAISYRKPFLTSGLISKACPNPICSSGSPAISAKRSLMNWEAKTVWALSTASEVVR